MKRLFSISTAMPMLFVLMITGCSKKNEKEVIPKPDIGLATSATLGAYLTNKEGQALYMFANDPDGTSTCAGGCAALWPAFSTDLTAAKLSDGLVASDFAMITNPAGNQQVTYKGWPLYTYSPLTAGVNTPEAANETRGEGVGGVWFVAKTNYTITLVSKQLTGSDGINYKSDYTVGTGKTVYFANGLGRTIYVFANDSFNINKYTRADFSNNATWPLYEQDQIVVPSVLDKGLFGSITVFGRKQMTYKGWPLYYFGPDTEVRGFNKGVSVPVPGRWPVAVKDIVEAKR